jgi:hypothetical protein
MLAALIIIIIIPGATTSYFDVGSGPINLYDLGCTGAENSFTECANKPSASNCSLPGVGVFCTGN